MNTTLIIILSFSTISFLTGVIILSILYGYKLAQKDFRKNAILMQLDTNIKHFNLLDK